MMEEEARGPGGQDTKHEVMVRSWRSMYLRNEQDKERRLG